MGRKAGMEACLTRQYMFYLCVMCVPCAHVPCMPHWLACKSVYHRHGKHVLQPCARDTCLLAYTFTH